MTPSPDALLTAALATDPGRPFVTFYDEGSGERVELSVTTFANWVAKTANLLVDGLGLGPGDLLHLALPRHWQTPVWAVATWAAGLTLDVDGDPADASVAVCGPDGVERALAAPDVVALSLRPLGAPFSAGELPAGVIDFGREVAGYADRFQASAPSQEPELTALATRLATGWGLAGGGRLLVASPLEPLVEVLAEALVPLAAGASVVLVRGAAPERIEALAEAERVTARAGG